MLAIGERPKLFTVVSFYKMHILRSDSGVGFRTSITPKCQRVINDAKTVVTSSFAGALPINIIGFSRSSGKIRWAFSGRLRGGSRWGYGDHALLLAVVRGRSGGLSLGMNIFLPLCDDFFGEVRDRSVTVHTQLVDSHTDFRVLSSQ